MPEWITTAEAADLSGYTADYIRELIRDGRIAARKFGQTWQVDRRVLLAYVRNAESLGERRGRKRKLT